MFKIPTYLIKDLQGNKTKIEKIINKSLSKYRSRNGLTIDNLVEVNIQKTQIQWRLNYSFYPNKLSDLKPLIITTEKLDSRNVDFECWFSDPLHQAPAFKFRTDWKIITFKSLRESKNLK